ncbi:MAG TPA: dihydroorotate dehydrogenase-like protein [Candidatus Eisenbacteria bacterium]|nr:dihydroorotate dehydrogenase-like protein [Candidatus Eisenbacteria bacterium]
MIDLSTSYLGFELRSPLVLSASPLSEDLDSIRRAEDAGVAAVVLHSLFEEQLAIESHDFDHHLSHHAYSVAEALTYFPEPGAFARGPDAYLEHIRRVKAAVDVPVVASLNGVSSGGWVEFSRAIEQAGADALELNCYFVPTDPLLAGGEVERMYLDLVRDVRVHVGIPLAVKLPHFFSAIANVAHQLDLAGADGLVLFNRFYQPDIDLEQLEVVPNLTLSNPGELRLRLRWVAILYGHVKADLAVTGGVHEATDVLKAMMAGASIAMMASALLRHGVEHLRIVERDLRAWMEAHEYVSIRQMRGSMSHQHCAEPAAFERANYLKVLRSYAMHPGRTH